MLPVPPGGSVWLLNTELAGYSTMSSRATSGDGIAMAWKAGAELTLMERSGVLRIASRLQTQVVYRRRRCQL